MKQYKEHDLVILSSKQKQNNTYSPSEILLHINNNRLKLGQNNPSDIEGGYYKPHHLYITSNDEIKDGDWCIAYDRNGKNPYLLHWSIKGTQGNAPFYKKRKIITTTDKSLKIADFPELKNTAYRSLRQIPQKFIEYFINEYNKGNIITKVLIEYKSIFIPLSESILIDGITKVYWFPEGVCSEYTYHKNGEVGLMISKNRGNEYSTKQTKLIINPDNTINIKPIEVKMYSEETVIKAWYAGYNKAVSSINEDRFGDEDKAPDLPKWIEKNL